MCCLQSSFSIATIITYHKLKSLKKHPFNILQFLWVKGPGRACLNWVFCLESAKAEIKVLGDWALSWTLTGEEPTAHWGDYIERLSSPFICQMTPSIFKAVICFELFLSLISFLLLLLLFNFLFCFLLLLPARESSLLLRAHMITLRKFSAFKGSHDYTEPTRIS